MVEKEECPICFGTFNKNRSRKIICPFCSYIVCLECIQNYILSIYTEPECPNCKKEWEKNFWMDNLTKTFIFGRYKKHKENILFEKERSLLPATQEKAEKIKKKEKINNKLMELEHIYQEYMHQYKMIPFKLDGITKKESLKKNKEAYLKFSEIKFQIEYYEFRLKKVTSTKEMTPSECEQNYVKKNEEKRQFIKSCPIENCRGMLTTRWKCNLCGVKVCSKCQNILKNEEKHQCQKEDLETIELLEKDTKPCPNCGSLITRVSGCPQMFCTICKYSFDWKTGKRIQYEHMHNPHFFAWQAEHGNLQARNTQNGCFEHGVIDPYRMKNHLLQYIDKDNNEFVKLVSEIFTRAVQHNIYHWEPYFRQNEVDNEDIRIKYLLGKIDDIKMKRMICAREKKYRKNMDILQILQLYNTVSKDILMRIYVSKDAEQIINIWNEVYQLIKYVNKELEKIGERYNNTIRFISVSSYLLV